MTCTAVNHLHRRAVRFDLRVPGDENAEDFMYRATGNRHLLPEYMQVRWCASRLTTSSFLVSIVVHRAPWPGHAFICGNPKILILFFFFRVTYGQRCSRG